MEFLKMIPALVPLILKPLKAVTKHVVYPFEVNRNIHSLETATEDLRALKQDVQTEITSTEHENRMATEEIKLWLAQVEAIEQKAEKICESYQQLCRCILKTSPNLWSNYMISINAEKQYVQMKILCDKKLSIQMIVNRPPPLAQEMPASSSKSSNLESALQCIKDDKHNIIGIWGMGGVGKTHLLKQINNELTKEGAFTVVVFVTCSKECSEEKVQDEIIDRLSLSKNGNMEQKKITIYRFLNQRSFVMLLDDLWSRVDLETIGIPDPMVIVGSCKRKVVLTTRSTEVCGQMEVRKKIRVDVLKWDDAWSLFKEKVTEETINSDPLIQRCAMDVAKELGGLPLAMITIGRAMHDKLDPSEWEQALDLIKKARLNDVEFSSDNKSVFHILKFSYESLKTDALKQCFLHCSLWPEDHEINKKDLTELWMGLGLIEEPNIHAAYNVGYSNIRRLQAVCLLETIDYDPFVIKMHDLIRDMALWIANNQENEKDKWIVRDDTFKKSNEIEFSGHTDKFSLMYGTTEKVFLSTTCSSTKLSTLLVNNNRLCDLTPIQFAAFSELAVLDLSWNSFEAFPVEICKLIQLRFLNLSGNSALKSLPEEMKDLINLKYLLCWGTEQCTIPIGVLSKLKALRVLELRHKYLDRARDMWRNFLSLKEEIQCLSHFEALGFTVTSIRDFHMLSQTSIVPVRGLDIMILEEEQCVSFTSCFLGNSLLQNNLLTLELNCIHVKWVKFERKSDEQSICILRRLENLSFNRMENMEQVIWMGLDPKDVFFRLQVLHFEYCKKLTTMSWVARLPCIRVLRVVRCTNIKQLINIDELNNDGLMVCSAPFAFLKKLTLMGNFNLKKITDPVITFPDLEILEVHGCNKLLRLPFKTNNPPAKLKLEGTKEWWNNIVLDDIIHKSILQPFFIEYEDHDHSLWCKKNIIWPD